MIFGKASKIIDHDAFKDNPTQHNVDAIVSSHHAELWRRMLKSWQNILHAAVLAGGVASFHMYARPAHGWLPVQPPGPLVSGHIRNWLRRSSPALVVDPPQVICSFVVTALKLSRFSAIDTRIVNGPCTF